MTRPRLYLELRRPRRLAIDVRRTWAAIDVAVALAWLLPVGRSERHLRRDGG